MRISGMAGIAAGCRQLFEIKEGRFGRSVGRENELAGLFGAGSVTGREGRAVER